MDFGTKELMVDFTAKRPAWYGGVLKRLLMSCSTEKACERKGWVVAKSSSGPERYLLHAWAVN